MEKMGNKLIYYYYPENENRFGVVSFDLESKECMIVKLSENDRHQIYALKLFRRMREFADNNFFEEEGSVVWY